MGDTADFLGRIDIAPPLSPRQAGSVLDSGPCRVDGAGRCLTFDDETDLDQLVPLLRHLVRLVKPEHRLDGMVVGCRRGSGELLAITVSNNRVTTRVLRRGVPSTRRDRGLADVIDLDSRRPSA